MRPFEMALPRTAEEAVRAASAERGASAFLAGGTDLVGELKERTAQPARVVNLKHIPGLDRIERTERGLEIGALVTLRALAEHATIRDRWPALAHAVGEAATPQLRNVGTAGGNLCQRPRCWYYRDATYPCRKKGGTLCYAQSGENEYHAIFDNGICCAVHPSSSAPVYMIHDALVDITGPEGTTTRPVAEFFTSPSVDVTRENLLGPQELITRIVLPESGVGSGAAYVEIREKQSFDWALCAAAVRLDFDGNIVRDCRVVLGAVAPLPLRRPDVEAKLRGKRLDDRTTRAALDTVTSGAEPLAENAYKVPLLKAVLRRALAQAARRN